MKTTKGGKVMNPTDAYRKELRKKELKRNKKERKKVREVGILKKDPETLKEQIDKLEMMKADGALDKARKHKKRQLEDTLNLVMKKRKEYEDKMREKGETPVMFSHLGPVRKRTAGEEDERANHPKPEDSVYYHPTLNPTGAPPPGKLPMYKSPIGSRTSNAASSSMSELDEADLTVPPPPPPPPLPSNELSSAEDSDIPKSLSVAPPPPVPSISASESSSLMPPPPPPPPPPSAPSEVTLIQPPLPPPPPGTTQTWRENKQNASSNDENAKTLDHAAGVVPPPPPPGLPPKLPDQHSATTTNQYNVAHNSGSADVSMVRLPPPPPPPRHPPPVMPRFPVIPSSQTDALPPGITHFPPPPPPLSDLRPQGLMSGISNRPPPPPPPGMLGPPLPMPPYGLPPGLPLMGGLLPMMRPQLFPGHPFQEDENTAAGRLFIPQKPSYIKSAASTVVKRPLAQHTPELTAMIPASVRVRRETAVPKAKPKPQIAASNSTSKPLVPTVVMRSEESRAVSSATKSQSIDDSYTAFLEDMKALGALDS